MGKIDAHFTHSFKAGVKPMAIFHLYLPCIKCMGKKGACFTNAFYAWVKQMHPLPMPFMHG